MADGQGLGGGEHEGRQVLAAEPGGLVQAVADVDQQLPGRLPAGTGLGARMTGSPGLVVMAYPGLKSGPGPIREMACCPLPGSRVSPRRVPSPRPGSARAGAA